MRKLLAIAAAVGALALAAPASAQPWQSINQRQAQLDQRIDTGVRDGSLTRVEARRLRSDYQSLNRLEARYRVNGLSWRERADLDRRFNALSAQIRYQRHDDQTRNTGPRGGAWVSINQRRAELDRRITQGQRDGSLSRLEASRLRAEFRGIARLEARYRRNGLSTRERTVLDQRRIV